MSKCDDLFQERQRLIKERSENDADLTRLRNISASKFPDDDELAKDLTGKFKDDLKNIQNDPDFKKAVDDPKSAEVNIPDNQPNNFLQMARTQPKEIIEKWGSYSQALLQAGRRVRPQDFTFLNYNVNNAAQEISETLQGDISKDGVMRFIERNSMPFNGLVDNTLRLRGTYQIGRKVFIENAEEIMDFMQRTNVPTELPADLLDRTIDTYKIALMTERSYDFVRNTWSKMGKAMQGPGFEDMDLDLVMKGVSEGPINLNDIPTVQAAREMEPEDFLEGSPIAKIMEAADLFKSNRKAAMQQLELTLSNLRIQGFDVFKIYDPNTYHDELARLTNLHFKDQQLFNLRTQGLNIGSNAILAIAGPTRKMYENMLYVPYGTPLMNRKDEYVYVLQSHFDGLGKALSAFRASGKEIFMDAFRNRSLHYAGNIDSYGKYFKTDQQRLQELKVMLNDSPKTPGEKRRALLNPRIPMRKMGAWIKLRMYEQTNDNFWLSPGLQLLQSVDNVSGFFYHNYSVRFDILMDARRNGVQLGLTDINGDLDPVKIDKYVAERMEAQFYSHQVTEEMIKDYRRLKSFDPELASDADIADYIREDMIAKTYGAPVLSEPEARAAAKFSDELRFQNKPENRFSKYIYEAGMGLKRNPVIDQMFPYMQAPFMGTSMDYSWTGIPYVMNRLNWDRMSDAQRRRANADFMMASTVWMAWISLSATDNIVGNGPPDYMWKERQEWLAELKAKGQRPNSIAGIPMVGGLPVISSIFLLEDARYAWQHANVSENDFLNIGNALFTVLVGDLSRKTAVGNVRQVLELAFNPERSNPGNYFGYMAAGMAPFSGAIREGERLSGAKQSQIYREREWSKEEETIFEPGVVEKAERFVRNEIMYKLYPGSAFFGGKFKERDWLGTKIRLAWGENFNRYVEHRFTPRQHPNDKVYAELNKLDLLDPPGPLVNKTLEGVPMSDDLQQLYNHTYGTIEGDSNSANQLIKGTMNINPKIEESVVIDDGQLIIAKNKENGLPYNSILEEHVVYTAKDAKRKLIPDGKKVGDGKTAIEAFRSLMSDPRYQALQKNKATTTYFEVQDKGEKERKAEMPYILMQKIKHYYRDLATNSLRVSNEPAAIKWKQRAETFKEISLMKGNEEREVLQELF
tara:strand:- start:1538 stop:4963 length:3426 start_codon:yes stop_codon:yes gene_type:complete